MQCEWKFASLLIRSLVGRSGISVNIPTNWLQNCKRVFLSRLLKARTACNLYGRRLSSLCKMRSTVVSDMRKAWACLHAVRLGLRLTDASTPACCHVCELRTADLVAFYTWQSILHATILHIDGLRLEMGLPVDSVHGKIRAESV